MNDNPNSFGSKLEIVKASDIKPKQVRWLWYPYIPFGKVTLLQGDPGDGKSNLMLSLAALLSNGAPLPFSDDEESYEPVTIIYQTTEDDADAMPSENASETQEELVKALIIKDVMASKPGTTAQDFTLGSKV